MSTYFLYGLVTILFIISWVNDPQKSKKALKIAWKSFSKLLPTLIPVMVGIGIVLSFLNPEAVSMILGEQSGVLGMLLGVLIGSVAFMPGFVAFPLGATLLSHGAGYPQIAGFVSSLMAVGVVSLSAEIKYFGKKTAIIRNLTALVAVFVFVFLVWGGGL